MPESTLIAQERTDFGKGAARAVRRSGRVPAVLYGHGADTRHLSLPGHELMLALKHGGTNALLTVQVGGTEQLALPKAVTRDPIRGFLEHVDLILVRRGEKVTVDLHITTTGETNAEVLISLPITDLSVEAEATNIPNGVEIDIEGMQIGNSITAGEVTLPDGVTLLTDPEQIVVSAQAAPTAEQLDAELAEAEAEVGIEQDQPEEETAEGTGDAGAPAAEGESAEEASAE